MPTNQVQSREKSAPALHEQPGAGHTHVGGAA
jgi:hypothetical protein